MDGERDDDVYRWIAGLVDRLHGQSPRRLGCARESDSDAPATSAARIAPANAVFPAKDGVICSQSRGRNRAPSRGRNRPFLYHRQRQHQHRRQVRAPRHHQVYQLLVAVLDSGSHSASCSRLT